MVGTERLARLSSDQFQRGLTPDLKFDTAPLFVEGENVIFTDGAVIPLRNQSSLVVNTSASPVRGITEHRLDGRDTAYWGTLDKLWRYDAVNGLDDRSKAGGYTGLENQTATQIATQWSFVSWSGSIDMIATNGVDKIQIDKGADFVDIGGTPPDTAEIILPFRTFVIAFNTATGGNHIRWCDDDAPEDWVETGTNASRNLIVEDLPSDIRAAVRLGPSIAFYSDSTMHELVWRSAPFYFLERPLRPKVGAVGKASVVSVGDLNYGFSNRGIFMTDGTSYEFIDRYAVRDAVFNDLNRTQISKVVAWHNRIDDLVGFFYPTATSSNNNRAVLYSRKDKNWTIWAIGREAASDLGVFDGGLLGTPTGQVFLYGAAEDPSLGGDSGEPLVNTATALLECPVGGLGAGGAGHGFAGGILSIDG